MVRPFTSIQPSCAPIATRNTQPYFDKLSLMRRHTDCRTAETARPALINALLSHYPVVLVLEERRLIARAQALEGGASVPTSSPGGAVVHSQACQRLDGETRPVSSPEGR